MFMIMIIIRRINVDTAPPPSPALWKPTERHLKREEEGWLGIGNDPSGFNRELRQVVRSCLGPELTMMFLRMTDNTVEERLRGSDPKEFNNFRLI